jgi:hypothetical protein
MTDRNSNDPEAGLGAQDHITPAPALAIEIERQRIRLFRAMALVETTKNALPKYEQLSERDTLAAAYEIMDEVAGKLNEISGHDGPLPEEEDGADAGAQS